MTDFDTISNKNLVGMALGELGSGFGSGSAGTSYLPHGSNACALGAPFGHNLNNNYSFDIDEPSTSRCDTHPPPDDDEDSSILSNLPTSCHEFEIKEMCIRMERSGNSPLAGTASPCVSAGRASSGCPSAEPPVHDVDPDDLEVQMINEIYEQQQLYASGDLEQLFNAIPVECPKEQQPSVKFATPGSSSDRRLPFTKNLRSVDEIAPPAPQSATPPISPPFSQFIAQPNLCNAATFFQPLLTPKSEALASQRKSMGGPLTFVMPEVANKRRVSEPFSARMIPHHSSGRNVPAVDNSRHVSFDYSLLELPESLRFSPTLPTDEPVFAVPHLPPLAGSRTAAGHQPTVAVPSLAPSPPLPVNILSRPDNLCDQTECLATQVVESLFTPQQPSVMPQSNEATRSGNGPTVRKCSRRLDMSCVEDRAGSSDSPLFHTDLPPLDDDPWKEVEMSSGGPVREEEPEEDSWETLDDAALDEQLSQLKLEAARKAKEVEARTASTATSSGTNAKRSGGSRYAFANAASSKTADVSPVPDTSWDPKFLSHVLEVYEIPPKQSVRTVKTDLVNMGFESVDVKMSGVDCGLVVFESERRAIDAQVMHKHAWIKLRPLYRANRESQDAARRLEAELRPRAAVRPRTSGAVARRLVENSLGVKSGVSREQRDTERRQLQAAKEAKKAAEAHWN